MYYVIDTTNMYNPVFVTDECGCALFNTIEAAKAASIHMSEVHILKVYWASRTSIAVTLQVIKE